MKMAIEYVLKNAEVKRLANEPAVIAHKKAEKELKILREKILGLSANDNDQYQIDGGLVIKSLKSQREFLPESSLAELLKDAAAAAFIKPYLQIGYKTFNLDVTVID